MSIGKIGEFKVGADDWALYVERLQHYFIVNGIASELYVSTLITVMGAESYELLVNLCTPNKPSTMAFKQLSAIMEKHLQPKPSILAERFKFRQRKQKEGESVSEYCAVLKKMTKFCDFGAWLEESIRDQFVCGISSEVIRQRLFAEEKLDYTKAYSLAMSLEAAEKNAAVVDNTTASSSTQPGGSVECLAITSARQKNTHSWSTQAREEPRQVYGSRTHKGGDSHPTVTASTWKSKERGQRPSPCTVCGKFHDKGRCKFVNYVCRVCNKQGHLRRMCPLLMGHHHWQGATSESPLEDHQNSEATSSDEVNVSVLNKLSIAQCKPIYIKINVHDRELSMECDTGSAISCINYDIYKKLFSNLKINNCALSLRYYTGEIIKPMGVIKPLVKYNTICKTLDLFVIDKGKTNLLGRQWIAELKIKLPTLCYDNVNNVNKIQSEDFNLSAFSSRYCKVFEAGLGRFTGEAVSIRVRAGAQPVFMRARPLAYALRKPVELALDQLVSDGILTPVDHSDWATPIVPVIKKDGTIRICADYKLTLNKVLEIDRYPLPRVEDLLVRLQGGERYSKIDLSQAYAQFSLDESKKYTVINTHKGLFMFNRLVYGLASSPGIFQKRLEHLFADLPTVGVFLDDIIITGVNREDHIKTLHKVFERLQSYGLKVKQEKCTFFAESVTYLGYVINKKGIHTCQDKVKAINNTPAPTNVSELRAFLGMVMYYAKFIKNISTVLAPLYNLLRSNVEYVWCIKCQEAFAKVKQLLSSSQVLVHYSMELPLVLTADTSSVGLGAVLSHMTPDGERPVAYSSRSLTTTERAYSQIDREALAIVFGIRKYHQYLYGRRFTLRTDHKPLTHIFGSKVGIPIMAASRLQRWAILLSGYNYDIEYVSSNKNCADALSRLPQGTFPRDKAEITYLNFVENFLPITHSEVKIQTAKDKELSKILLYIQSGWPLKCPEQRCSPFYMRRNELYVDCGCIMWGYRIIIPQSLQNIILKQLHSSHMGIVKTKSLARSYVWWPNIDRDIEDLCRSCETCAVEADAPPRSPPHPWPFHLQPWSRLHIDFLGPFHGKTYMVLIDATSKWLEAFEMSRTTATQVIKVLRSCFARFGLPVELVSDQGPPFTSLEFKDFFLTQNGITQYFSPTYHPASNGAAENAVKLCKSAIKTAYRDNNDVDTALQNFLLTYRNTPQSTTGETPAMLLQRRTLRSRLDLLRSERSVQDRVRYTQNRQTEYAGGVMRELSEGDTVWLRNYASGDKWSKGVVETKIGARQYRVNDDHGRPFKKHIDQLRRRSRLSGVVVGSEVSGDNTLPVVVDRREDDDVPQDVTPSKDVEKENSKGEDSDIRGNVLSPCKGPDTEHTPPPPVNRARRIRKPVDKFQV